MALVVSFRILGLSLLIPVIAVHGSYFTDSTVLVGIALGGYGASQALFQIPYGIASDRFGRKNLIITGMLVFSIGSFLGGSADSIGTLIAARILQGAGAVTATVFAFINDVIDVQRRNFVTAIIGAPIGIFFSIGVVAGPLLAHAYGVDTIFHLSGIFGLIAAGYIRFFVHEENRTSDYAFRERYRLRSAFSDIRLLKTYVAGLLMYSAVSAIFFITPLLMADRFGLSMNEFVYVYFPMIAVAIGAMLLFSRAADRGRTKGMILLGFFMVAAGSAGMIAGQTLVVFTAAAIVTFAGANALEPILPILVGKTARPETVGAAMGAYSTIQFSGSFAGALAVGALLPLGYSPALICLAAIGGCGMLLAASMDNPPAAAR
jgi:MFS family permease